MGVFFAAPESARWRNAALGALVLLAVFFALDARRGFPHGGSSLGLTYGALALAAILVLLFFGVRKRRYKSRWGRLETWLQIHVYLGLLSFVLVLLHTGFRFHDKVAISAFLVLTAVVLSGIWGALLYRQVPRLLSEVETNLPPDKISEQLNQLARAMARLAAERSAPFREVHRALLAEALPRGLAGWRILRGRRHDRGDREGGEAAWTGLLARVGREEQEDLRRLLVFARQHRALHRRFVAQQRYKNLLEVWLFLHIPLSIALLALVAAHLVAVIYFS